MERNPIDSSNIASIGYDASLQVLEVEFVNGGVYQYRDVSSFKYNSLLSADSPGKYFYSHIRSNHPYERVE